MHEHGRDFRSGTCVDCHVVDKAAPGLALSPDAGRALFTSAALETERPFSEAILSVNVTAGSRDDTGLVALLSATDGGDWTPWFRMLRWGLSCEESGVTRDAAGRVDTDVLRLEQASTVWRYQINWRTEGAKPVIRRVAISFKDSEPAPVDAHRSAWGKRLAVPFHSQWDVADHTPSRVCSPTTVAMVAGFYGLGLSAAEIATQSYDPQHDIYGNWSLNMLAVSRHGLCAIVAHGQSLHALEESVTAGAPVVTSVAYDQGALSGAPQPASAGHLVVVAGFTDEGDVWVRDPAARGEDAWITYRRDEFERAWLGHGGITYRIQPETTA